MHVADTVHVHIACDAGPLHNREPSTISSQSSLGVEHEFSSLRALREGQMYWVMLAWWGWRGNVCWPSDCQGMWTYSATLTNLQHRSLGYACGRGTAQDRAPTYTFMASLRHCPRSFKSSGMTDMGMPRATLSMTHCSRWLRCSCAAGAQCNWLKLQF